MSERKNIILLFIICIFYLSSRVFYLGTDITNTDATRWYDRSKIFFVSLKNRDFINTFQHYQPGVTLMYIHSFVSYFTKNTNISEYSNKDIYPLFHKVLKTTLVFTLFALFLLIIFLITKLHSFSVSLLFGLIFSLEPYLIGIDRWFHLTSLESYTGFIAILFILIYKKYKRFLFILPSCLFLSLSVLSKVTSLALFPVIFLIIVNSSTNLKRSLAHTFLYLFCFCCFCFIFFPALWVSPFEVTNSIFFQIQKAVDGNYRNDLLKPLVKVFFYVLVFIYKTSLPLLMLFLFSLIKNFKNHNFSVYLYIVVYYLTFLSISDQKIDRYFIAVLPYVTIYAAIHLAGLTTRFKSFYTVFTLFNFAYLLWLHFPVMSGYYNPFFGGTRSALRLGVYDNSGEYLAQTAFYLNQFGKDIVILLPNGYSSFSPYYKGMFVSNTFPIPNYSVFIYDLTRPTIENYGCDKLVKEFGPRNFSVIYVFKCL